MFPIVVVIAAIGCDDFTCEDYATCDSPETARDGGGGDSGKFAGSTATGVSDGKASSAPAPEGGMDDSNVLGSSSADRGDADNAANESSTTSHDSGVTSTGSPAIVHDSGSCPKAIQVAN